MENNNVVKLDEDRSISSSLKKIYFELYLPKENVYLKV